MKTVFRIMIFATVALLMVSKFGTLSGSAHEGDNTRRLQGSWVIAAIPSSGFINCTGSPLPAPPPFTELATYATEGTLTETNTILNANSSGLSAALPFNASDGHGAWESEGSGYKARFRKLVFDASGNYVANADISEKLELETSTRTNLQAASPFNSPISPVAHSVARARWKLNECTLIKMYCQRPCFYAGKISSSIGSLFELTRCQTSVVLRNSGPVHWSKWRIETRMTNCLSTKANDAPSLG